MKAALHNIMNAENRDAADLAIDQFEASYGAKYAEAVDKVLKDRDVLLTHFEFPAEHWIHLRTTNVIESTFATVKLRTRKTKGAGSRAAGLAMAYKLLEAAQARWRCVNAPHLVALVRAGATFVDGFIIEREDQQYAA
jgi:transposase-like protein